MLKFIHMALALIAVLMLREVLTTNTFFGSISFVNTNIFTKSKDLNSLYAVGTTDFKVYRVNYTRNLTTASYNYNYSTTHTKKARAIAVSHG